MQVQCAAFLLLASTSGVAAVGMRGALVSSHHTQAVRTVDPPAPAGAATETTAVDVEVKNLDYMGMTKTWHDPETRGNPNDWMMEMNNDAPKKKKSKKSSGKKGDMPQGPDEMANALDDTLGNALDGGLAPPVENNKTNTNEEESETPFGELPALPWPTGGGAAFVQVDHSLARQIARHLSASGPMTVQAALKASVEGAIDNCLPCNLLGGPGPAPAPGPAPTPQMALQPQPPSGMIAGPPAGTAALLPTINVLPGQAPAPGPAPGPSPGPAPGPAGLPCQRPKVHVEVLPGKKMKKRHMINRPAATAGAAPPQTTLLRVTLFERPGNGIDDTAGLKTKLKTLMHTGVLKASLEVAIEAVTGVKPKLAHLKVHSKAIPLWDVKKCGNHMSKIVKSFAVHYTRRQVPMALYNACSTFMTKMSFSHDYILDNRDAVHCRTATRSFAQRWKMGRKDSDPEDFEQMCGRFCQAKYGDDSPQCQFA